MRFAAEMARRVDDELFAIVSAPPGEWEPEAIEAAKLEIANRDLGSSLGGPYRNGDILPDRAQVDPAAPLDDKTAVRAFLFGTVFGVLAVLMAVSTKRRYVKSGEPRKGTSYLRWTIGGAVVGIVFWMVLRSM
jgi:hypothetical protein